MAIFKSTFSFLFILIAHSSFCQTSEKKVSIELSTPHTREFAYINDCSSSKKVSVTIHNRTDTTNYFYEDWNSYGYYNITFQVKVKDSIYEVIRPRKWWYRNYPSYYVVNPNESLVFNYSLIDTSCAARLFEERIFENGWIGFPPFSDTVEIRAVYQLCDLTDSIPREPMINRLNYRIDSTDYSDYLDFDIEIPFESNETPPQEPVSELNPIIIFHEPLISDWQKVIYKY